LKTPSRSAISGFIAAAPSGAKDVVVARVIVVNCPTISHDKQRKGACEKERGGVHKDDDL
jgi:hypothetical protein